LKSAVLYYSRTGKTAVAAKALADKISSDLIEIKDIKNRNGIIGWIRALLDARGMKTTQIEPNAVNTADYDTICFGTPIWAGNPTPAINTIIKNCEIVGKDVILFVTLGGNKPKNMLNLMRKEVEEKGGNVIKTIAIENSGKKSDEDIINEINEIDIAI
jgi:flavodoxin